MTTPSPTTQFLQAGCSGVGTMGTLYPKVQDLYSLYPPSQRCGLCQNFKQTTLTTRLYKVRTNLYPPPLTYENIPTRLVPPPGSDLVFDTVRHSSLLHKLAQLDFPDHICNWLADFFYDHSHCTLFCDQQSSLLDVTASIIQGSAIGPAAYVVTAGDLTAAVSGNSVCKFADDTDLISLSSNEPCRHIELVSVQNCRAKRNNLKLNV